MYKSGEIYIKRSIRMEKEYIHTKQQPMSLAYPKKHLMITIFKSKTVKNMDLNFNQIFSKR